MTLLLTALAAVQISMAAPQPVAEIDTGKLKGELARLAWSDDGSEFYIQTVERDRTGSPKAAHHYLVSTTSKNVKDVDQEPAWAAKYWQWKSGQASPAGASFKISVDERTETKRAAVGAHRRRPGARRHGRSNRRLDVERRRARRGYLANAAHLRAEGQE